MFSELLKEFGRFLELGYFLLIVGSFFVGLAALVSYGVFKLIW